MIDKSLVENNILTLEDDYNSADSDQKRCLYSKLALLELSGWIEEAVDELVKSIAKKKLSQTNESVFNEKIEKIHGFKYEYFRDAIVCLIGIINVNIMEKTIKPKIYEPFKAELNNIWTSRIESAHTYSKIKTVKYTPTITKASLNTIFMGLVEVEKILQSMRYRKRGVA